MTETNDEFKRLHLAFEVTLDARDECFKRKKQYPEYKKKFNEMIERYDKTINELLTLMAELIKK